MAASEAAVTAVMETLGTADAEAATKARWLAVTDAEEAMGVVHIVEAQP